MVVQTNTPSVTASGNLESDGEHNQQPAAKSPLAAAAQWLLSVAACKVSRSRLNGGGGAGVRMVIVVVEER